MPGLHRYRLTPKSSHAPAEVTTSTSRKTVLQVAVPSTRRIAIVSWGISFAGSAAGEPMVCDLVETDVAATMTTASQTPELMVPGIPASVCTGAGTGWNGSAEGSITASRLLDVVEVPPTSGYVMRFDLGREPVIAVSTWVRVRVIGSSGVTPDCLPFLEWEE